MTGPHDSDASDARSDDRTGSGTHGTCGARTTGRTGGRAASGRDVAAVLADYDVPTTVERRIHAVPPHEVYEVTVDDERAVCKLVAGPTADAQLEGRVLRFVEENTRLPVPDVLAEDEDHFLARWSEGLQAEPTVDAARLHATGRGLGHLHADAANRFEAPGTLGVDDGDLAVAADDRWSATLLTHLEQCRPSVEVLGCVDLLADLLAFVRSHRRRYDAGEGPTLLHGNFLPEHVGLDRGGDDAAEVACVIDFEHALVGPPAYDLLRTAVPTLGAPWELRAGEAAEDGWIALRTGYESVRPLPAGVEERLALHAPVDAVRYLRALHVQRGPLDSPRELARRARDLREYGREALARCREATE